MSTTGTTSTSLPPGLGGETATTSAPVDAVPDVETPDNPSTLDVVLQRAPDEAVRAIAGDLSPAASDALDLLYGRQESNRQGLAPTDMFPEEKFDKNVLLELTRQGYAERRAYNVVITPVGRAYVNATLRQLDADNGVPAFMLPDAPPVALRSVDDTLLPLPPSLDAITHIAQTTNDTLPFDREQIILTGSKDNEAWELALEVAHKLIETGVWDGQARIEFNAHRVHKLLFGTRPISLTGLTDQFGSSGIFIPEAHKMTGQAHIAYIKRQRHSSVDCIKSTVMAWSREDMQILLDAEREDLNRKSLIKWLESRLEDALSAQACANLDWAERRALNDIPIRQREILLAVATGQPVVKNAATRSSLCNRGLVKSYDGGTNHDWWGLIELTEKGQQIAALLVKIADPDQGSAPKNENADVIDALRTPAPADWETVKNAPLSVHDTLSHIDDFVAEQNDPGDYLVVDNWPRPESGDAVPGDDSAAVVETPLKESYALILAALRHAGESGMSALEINNAIVDEMGFDHRLRGHDLSSALDDLIASGEVIELPRAEGIMRRVARAIGPQPESAYAAKLRAEPWRGGVSRSIPEPWRKMRLAQLRNAYNSPYLQLAPRPFGTALDVQRLRNETWWYDGLPSDDRYPDKNGSTKQFVAYLGRQSGSRYIKLAYPSTQKFFYEYYSGVNPSLRSAYRLSWREYRFSKYDMASLLRHNANLRRSVNILALQSQADRRELVSLQQRNHPTVNTLRDAVDKLRADMEALRDSKDRHIDELLAALRQHEEPGAEAGRHPCQEILDLATQLTTVRLENANLHRELYALKAEKHETLS